MKPHSQRLQGLNEIRAFLGGGAALDFRFPSRAQAYDWIEASLRQLGYLRLVKADKGLVRDHLLKLSGFSRAQVARLITQYRDTGYGHGRPAPAWSGSASAATHSRMAAPAFCASMPFTRVIWTASKGSTISMQSTRSPRCRP